MYFYLVFFVLMTIRHFSTDFVSYHDWSPRKNVFIFYGRECVSREKRAFIYLEIKDKVRSSVVWRWGRAFLYIVVVVVVVTLNEIMGRTAFEITGIASNRWPSCIVVMMIMIVMCRDYGPRVQLYASIRAVCLIRLDTFVACKYPMSTLPLFLHTHQAIILILYTRPKTFRYFIL